MLKGQSGPGVISIGGCDYHDGTQTAGDTKDREIGIEIGRAVEYAHKIQVPLMIQVITDGGIYPREGSRTWQGDSVDTCMSVVGYYRPDAAPKYIRQQVGAYTNTQGADQSTIVGANPLFAAYGVFANYLQAAGRLGEFQKIIPGVFSDQQLQSLLIFEG